MRYCEQGACLEQAKYRAAENQRGAWCEAHAPKDDPSIVRLEDGTEKKIQ